MSYLESHEWQEMRKRICERVDELEKQFLATHETRLAYLREDARSAIFLDYCLAASTLREFAAHISGIEHFVREIRSRSV